VANLSYYDFSTLITDYTHVMAIYNNNTSKWLDYMPFKLLQELDARWETKIGNPVFFTVLDDSYVSVYPKLGSAVGSMLVLYKGLADTLLAAGTPIIQTQHQVVLEQYTTMDLLEQAEEFVKAQEWMGEYFE